MYESLIKFQPGLERIRIKPVSSFLLSAFSRIISRIFGLRYNLSHSYYASRYYGKIAGKLLRSKNYDLIVAPAMSTVISGLKTDIPLIYVSDVTVKLMYNYYEWFSGFTFFSFAESNAIERRALHRADRVVMSSRWAADSAVRDYQTDSGKISVVPFGANMQSEEILPVERVISRTKGDICRLLFIGMEWERKGGRIVLEAMDHMHENSFACELTILGCDPPEAEGRENVNIIPYIDKKTLEGKEQWNELMLSHHFLILPTQAECFGVVFCEASAYGMPSVATDTGGVPNAVINGRNGYRLPMKADGGEYAGIIMEMYNDFEGKYLPLSKSSRQTFDELLNWDKWAEKVNNVIEDLLQKNEKP